MQVEFVCVLASCTVRKFEGQKFEVFTDVDLSLKIKTSKYLINACVKIVLFKYFKKKALPHPNGPLAEVIPSNSTEVANKTVEFMIAHKEIGSERKAMKRGPYTKFSQLTKITVVKYAAEHGVRAVLQYINSLFYV